MGPGMSGLDWAGLGWAGLGWAGLGQAGLPLVKAREVVCVACHTAHKVWCE